MAALQSQCNVGRFGETRSHESIKPSFEITWVLWTAGVLIALSLLAISSESFWIDEFTTTHFASQPSLRAMWQEMLRLKWPELQAPLYMVYMWAWQHLLGTGEWISRLAGVPWFVAGATFFVISFRKPLERICALFITALNPFSWFYLNEARPYSIELGLSYLVVAALIRLQRATPQEPRFEARRLEFLCLSIWLLAVLTVLGMIWVSAAFLILAALVPHRKILGWVREHWILFGATALALALCSVYYLWTRSLGTRAASLGGGDWKNLGFILYEQLGFNGLGPGRLALREGGLAALAPWFGLMAAYAAAIGIVSVGGLRQLIHDRMVRPAMVTAVALAVPMCFLVAIGFLMNFRLLGRHCTPAVAVIVLFLTLGATNLWLSNRWWTRLGLVIFLSLSLLSCLSQRFAARHAKDDYRSAVQIAQAALNQGRSVWWNAETFGCEYYHLSSGLDGPGPGKAWILKSPFAGFDKGIAPPDIVVVSKPDVYDVLGAVQEFLKREGYRLRQRFPAFAVFERPDKASRPEPQRE